jgi:hypothetical protein
MARDVGVGVRTLAAMRPMSDARSQRSQTDDRSAVRRNRRNGCVTRGLSAAPVRCIEHVCNTLLCPVAGSHRLRGFC